LEFFYGFHDLLHKERIPLERVWRSSVGSKPAYYKVPGLIFGMAGTLQHCLISFSNEVNKEILRKIVCVSTDESNQYNPKNIQQQKCVANLKLENL
jgi:hypothetical protein